MTDTKIAIKNHYDARWYDQLCADVRHEAGAVAAFEAIHGERNWP